MDESAEMIEESVNEGPDWLTLARDAYSSSTSYFDSSLRRQWEKNLSMFRSKHSSGSKYNSDAYKFRSKNFRPKTRSAITRNEAQAAVAFFSTADIVHVSPQNEADEAQHIVANLNGELLNYRLSETIPWFLTCIGGFQEAMTLGAVVSKQHWIYEKDVFPEYRHAMNPETGEGLYDEDGEPQIEKIERTVVHKDKPAVDLIPIENIRFDPAADWRDVVGTSPYWISMFPMYLGDVKARMNREDPKTGQPVWKPMDDDALTSATNQDHDSVRQARQGSTRQDSHDSTGRSGDFRIVWIHENIIREGGRDWIYYTLGTEHLLSEPVPLEEVYFHGKRPFVMGYCVIEAHRTPPSGAPEIWEGLQTEINDVANQRLDNVRLVLNTRYFASRNGNVDTRALTRSVPGSVVLMDDINSSVRADRPNDVTASSYQEQDRLNIDFDEIAGSFSPGSVQSNRQLNETVGGMNMLSQDSNAMTEYRLRIFTETWVEPVLRQLVELEQAYETDEVVLGIAGQRAGVFDELGIDRIPEAFIQGPVTTRVNVGFGNINPQQRVEKLLFALNALSTAIAMPGIDLEEVRTEVFGALGYKDGARFFQDETDPRIAQLEQQLQEMQAMLEGKQAEMQNKLQIEQMRQEGKAAESQLDAQVKLQIEQARAQLAQVDRQLNAAQLKQNGELEVAKLLNQRQALLFQMQKAEADILQRNEEGRMSQTLMNDKYGMVPGQVG